MGDNWWGVDIEVANVRFAVRFCNILRCENLSFTCGERKQFQKRTNLFGWQLVSHIGSQKPFGRATEPPKWASEQPTRGNDSQERACSFDRSSPRAANTCNIVYRECVLWRVQVLGQRKLNLTVCLLFAKTKLQITINNARQWLTTLL